MQGQALNEALEFQLGSDGLGLCVADHGAERIDYDDPGVGVFHFLNDFVQHGAEVVLQYSLAEIDEMDRAVNFGHVEERELLLIAQHLDGRLAEHGKVQRGSLLAGVGEHHLMRERSFAASGCPGDDIEGVFGEAAAEDFIEAWDAGGKALNFHRGMSFVGIGRRKSL